MAISNRVLLVSCASLLLCAGCGGRAASSGADWSVGPDPMASADGRRSIEAGIRLDVQAPPPCPPGADPELAVELLRNGDTITARITNVGCKSAWRLQGCCGEDDPLIESIQHGKWQPALCAPGPGICCNAEPVCTEIKPGASFSLPVGPLMAQVCCGTTFRLAYGYSRNAGCIESADKIALVARSNSLELRKKDTCTWPPVTKCGDQSCNPDKAICVRKNAWLVTWECVPFPVDCAKDRRCSCLGKRVCTGGYTACADLPADNTIACGCPTC